MVCGDDLYRKISALVLDELDFLIGIERVMIDGHHHRQAEAMDVFDVFFEVFHSFVQGFDVGLGNVLKRHAAVQFQGLNRGHDHHGVGFQAGLAALDVHEFFRAQSAPKPASVTVYSERRMANLVAMMLLQPWAMLANGPP